MSLAALRWAWSVATGSPTTKAVLVALADCMSKDGRCDPSVNHLGRMTELSERAIRKAIVTLQAGGFIAIGERSGTSNFYTFLAPKSAQNAPNDDPAEDEGPARGAGGDARDAGVEGVHVVPPPLHQMQAPLHVVPPPPARGAPKPYDSTSTVTPSSQRQLALMAVASRAAVPAPTPPPPAEAKPKPRGDRGSRLPDDWRPSPDLRTFAAKLGVDVDAVAEEFADYWRGIPGQRGCKADWAATFRNRCRETAARNARFNRPRETHDERTRRELGIGTPFLDRMRQDEEQPSELLRAIGRH